MQRREKEHTCSPTRMLSSGLLATSAGTRSFSVSASWYTDIRMLPSLACLRYNVSAGQVSRQETYWKWQDCAPAASAFTGIAADRGP